MKPQHIILSIVFFALFLNVNGINFSSVSYEWKPLKVGAGGWVVGMYIHPAEPHLRYVRTDVAGAYRWDETASSWKQLVTSESLPGWFVNYATYSGVCSLVGADSNPGIVYMAIRGKIFKSTDQGDSWTSFDGFKLVSPTIDWLARQSTGWLSAGEILFDPLASGKLWFAEGFGVWYATDFTASTVTWTEQSAGIEETCGNAVICPPGGKPVTAMWDIGAFYHHDPDVYSAVRALPHFMSCWHLDWCPADPNFVAGVFNTNNTWYEENKTRCDYSTDGGKTWKRFNQQLRKYACGCVAVSANDKNNIVRIFADNSLPYYTQDLGNSWTQCVMPGVSATGLSNFTSPMKPLCADRVEAATFYLFVQGKGIYKSADGGANWTKASELPVQNRSNIMMKTVPGHAKDIWLAEGKQGGDGGGLWRSTDGGTSWNAIGGGLTQAFCFGFGKAKDSNGYPTVYAAGAGSNGHGIYRSTDTGNTWIRIGEYPLGIFDYVDDMDGDKEVFGKVYIAFAYSGFAYGTEKNNVSSIPHPNMDSAELLLVNDRLHAKNITGRSVVQIYSTSGTLLYEAEKISGFTVNLRHAGIRRGTYIVYLFNSHLRMVKKIIL